MMRLIDADEFIKKFSYAKDNTQEENTMCATVRRMVKEQPTAYDMENVLEQLEKSRGYIATTQYCNDMNGDSTCGVRSCFGCCLDYLIGIVKRGGIDETN